MLENIKEEKKEEKQIPIEENNLAEKKEKTEDNAESVFTFPEKKKTAVAIDLLPNNELVLVSQQQGWWEKFWNIMKNYVFYYFLGFIFFLNILFILDSTIFKEKDSSIGEFNYVKKSDQNPDFWKKIPQIDVCEKVAKLVFWVSNSNYFLREKSDNTRNEVNQNLLFHGPPGTGKTYLAKCFARNLSSYYIFATFGAEVYVGTENRKVRMILKNIRKALKKNKKKSDNRPVIVVIDEIDNFRGRNSSSSSHNASDVNSLLKFFDEIRYLNVIVIGITNYPKLVDEALTRQGRLGELVYIDYLKEHEIDTAVDNAKETFKDTYKDKFIFENENSFWELIKDYLKRDIREGNQKISSVDLQECIVCKMPIMSVYEFKKKNNNIDSIRKNENKVVIEFSHFIESFKNIMEDKENLLQERQGNVIFQALGNMLHRMGGD